MMYRMKFLAISFIFKSTFVLHSCSCNKADNSQKYQWKALGGKHGDLLIQDWRVRTCLRLRNLLYLYCLDFISFCWLNDCQFVNNWAQTLGNSNCKNVVQWVDYMDAAMETCHVILFELPHWDMHLRIRVLIYRALHPIFQISTYLGTNCAKNLWGHFLMPRYHSLEQQNLVGRQTSEFHIEDYWDLFPLVMSHMWALPFLHVLGHSFHHSNNGCKAAGAQTRHVSDSCMPLCLTQKTHVLSLMMQVDNHQHIPSTQFC